MLAVPAEGRVTRRVQGLPGTQETMNNDMDGRAYAEREVCGSLDELCHSLTVFLPPRAEYLHHGVIIILNFIYRYWLVCVCVCVCVSHVCVHAQRYTCGGQKKPFWSCFSFCYFLWSPSFHFIPILKTFWSKASCGGKSLFGFDVQVLVHHWRTSGQKFNAEPWYRNHGRMLLTGSLNGLYWARFLLKPGSIRLGMTSPTVSWALPPQSSFKAISHRHGHRPVWSGKFLN